MKTQQLWRGMASLMVAAACLPASSQVIIDYTSASTNPVPLSPWLSAFMAIALAAIGLHLLKKHPGRGLPMLALSTVVGSAGLMQMNPGHASYGVPSLQSLPASGNVITGTSVAWATYPKCGGIGYVWVQSGSGTVTISGISHPEGYHAFDPADPAYEGQHYDVTLPTAPAALCTVGTSLTGSASCVVWYGALSDRC